jgi:hypothetical protein
MKILHVLKSEPDGITRTLMDAVSEGQETSVVRLYENAPDYESLLDQIFSNEKVITWW